MKYFQYFPQIQYNFAEPDGNNVTMVMTNFTVRLKLVARLKQLIQVFQNYVIADGERPDTVAVKLYGSSDYTWIILLVNNIFSLYDWPLTSEEFTIYIVDKYGSITNAQSQLLYTTSFGDFVDMTTYNLLSGTDKGQTITAYDNELSINEAKRQIQVIPLAFVELMISELKNIATT